MYSLKTAALLLGLGIQRAVAAPVCPTPLQPITAAAAFAGLNPGWNLGNTLDATPTEGSWNNVPVVPSTFDAVKARGFKSVRIPVTWAYHFDTGSPSWTVNTTWMDRVETVVDEVLARGMYAVLNAHHDSWIWADVSASGANLSMIEEKFTSLWTQIGTRFKCKSSRLIFEPINEPPGSTAAAGAELNKLNDLFLTAINNAGGYNPKRVVSLSGLGMDSYKTEQFFDRGNVSAAQPWGLQFHYYSPYDFIFSAWGKTIWGSDSDKASVDLDFGYFRGNFTNIPVFIGEYDSSVANTETAARWKYFEEIISLCNKYSFSSIVWDNGGDLFDRTTDTWIDAVVPSIITNAVRNIPNALADSTTDASALAQNTSAYLFHKIGDPVVAQSVPYLLNNNTLRFVKTSKGKSLTLKQFSMSSTGIFTLSEAYLSTLITNTTAPGTLESLELIFSPGACLNLTITAYTAPTVAQSTYSVGAATSDLHIPIAWNGVARPAAVKAVLADGTCVADTWTKWLPELQHCRWTYDSSSWSSDATSFIVSAAGLSNIKSQGQNVTLTIESFPRNGDKAGSNAVNVTITV